MRRQAHILALLAALLSGCSAAEPMAALSGDFLIVPGERVGEVWLLCTSTDGPVWRIEDSDLDTATYWSDTTWPGYPAGVVPSWAYGGSGKPWDSILVTNPRFHTSCGLRVGSSWQEVLDCTHVRILSQSANPTVADGVTVHANGVNFCIAEERVTLIAVYAVDQP